MAKEKKQDVWEQIVSNVTEDNKQEVVSELESVIEQLEARKDKDLLPQFKATLKRIK